MNKILIFLFLLLSIGSATAYYQVYKTNEVVENDASKILDEPFGIKLQIDKMDADQYSLAVTIELDNGDYVISPYSKDEVYGHFDISIPQNNKFTLEETLLETPSSIEEFDPIINEPVRFVRENTTYKQKLKVTGQDDFEVSGLIWFVHEPDCIPYDVAFTISYHSGKMTVKKTKTSISKEYKE